MLRFDRVTSHWCFAPKRNEVPVTCSPSVSTRLLSSAEQGSVPATSMITSALCGPARPLDEHAHSRFARVRIAKPKVWHRPANALQKVRFCKGRQPNFLSKRDAHRQRGSRLVEYSSFRFAKEFICVRYVFTLLHLLLLTFAAQLR